VAGVKLQPPAIDGVVSLQHQGVFDVRVIDKFFHLRKEGFDVFVNAQPDAGGVDADIGPEYARTSGSHSGTGQRAESEINSQLNALNTLTQTRSAA